MKKYKLINVSAYAAFSGVEVYDEDYTPCLGAYTVKELVELFPLDWEEVI